MNFTYFTNLASSGCICRKTDFEKFIHSPTVHKNIELFRHGDASAKRRLPAFCFHALFKNSKRLAKFATYSGLVMLDFDHLTAEQLKQLAEIAIPVKGTENVSPILLVHITPSGKGLRVVFKATKAGEFAYCETLADYQHVMARQLHAEQFLDTVCTDLSRLSFCPQAEDVLYLSDRLFTDQAEVTEVKDSPSAATMTVQQPADQQGELFPENLQRTFEDVSLETIFEKYISLTGGMPKEGSRNSRYYAAARDLRYICDFNPRVIARYLPDCGLPADEVYQICVSACGSTRGSHTPDEVLKAVALSKDAEEADSTENENSLSATNALLVSKTTIPKLYFDFLRCCPADFREATLLSMLPILGTLATGVRAVYLDGESHSPSFFTVITSPQASGKSFARRLVKQLLPSIAAEDAQQRAIEQEYQNELKRKKNAKELPPAPRAKIRIVPATISIAKLLQRLDYAEGEHLFTFAEEMDTLNKSNRAGSWNNKFDTYRHSFDNSEYGQDYMSETTYSAVVNVYYNLLVLGTPRQTERFFSDVENGLASRCCFGFIPDQFGADFPEFQKMDEMTQMRIEQMVKKLREAKGTVDLSFLYPAISKWLKDQSLLAIKEANRARDIFRRRSAVMGFRAAMTVAPLYDLHDEENRTLLTHFAILVTDIVLRNQLSFMGERLNKILSEDNKEVRGSSRTVSLFNNLPDEFTVEDVQKGLAEYHMSTRAKQLVYVWKKSGLIEKLIVNNKIIYRKIK